jgi:hypothetical protein
MLTAWLSRLPLLLLALSALAFAAACDDGDDDDGEATETATGTSSAPADGSPSGSPAATPTTDEGGEGEPFETPSTLFQKEGQGEPALVREIRAAANTGYDRVVFEFEGDEVPGYEVGYVERVAECGSGEPVALTGGAVVSVTIRPANGHTEEGEATIPREVPTQGTAVVREVIGFCDFEAVVGYGIGLATAVPFRVFELESPPRLVIDFQQ